jgi:hypothetical protein
MDKIEFKVEKRKSGDYESDSVKILINDKDLIKLLKDFETPLAKSEGSENIAGGYDGLTSTELYESLTNRQGDDKSKILECECGSDGCWPFMTRILESTDKIVWADFEQPHRGQASSRFWDYATFGEFTFDKREYVRQVERLKTSAVD